MTHVLWTLFAWPAGIVLGNLLASVLWVPISVLGLYLFRNPLGRSYAAWLHKHHQAHLKALSVDPGASEGVHR